MVALTARRISWRKCRSDRRAKAPTNLHAKRVLAMAMFLGSLHLVSTARYLRLRQASRAKSPYSQKHQSTIYAR